MHEALDSMPKTVTRDIVRPYTYHKRIINITGVIQLQFRIENSLSEQRTKLVPISREEHKKDVLLEDVKSEDTKGVMTTGTMTDTAAFMTALENSARDELIAAVRKKVEALPATIYPEGQHPGERRRSGRRGRSVSALPEPHQRGQFHRARSCQAVFDDKFQYEADFERHAVKRAAAFFQDAPRRSALELNGQHREAGRGTWIPLETSRAAR